MIIIKKILAKKYTEKNKMMIINSLMETPQIKAVKNSLIKIVAFP